MQAIGNTEVVTTARAKMLKCALITSRFLKEGANSPSQNAKSIAARAEPLGRASGSTRLRVSGRSRGRRRELNQAYVGVHPTESSQAMSYRMQAVRRCRNTGPGY